MTNWLITGGCGFIGSALIARILAADSGASVSVVDNLTAASIDDLRAALPADRAVVRAHAADRSAGDISVIEADIRDIEVMEAAAAGIDTIVHLAANTGVPKSMEDPFHDATTNVMGSLNVLEAARRNSVGRVVLASSGAPLGVQEPPVHEEMAPRPMSPYGASKLASEGYASAYFHGFGVETVALRFSNVYGPGSVHKGSVVAKFLKQALAGETLEIYGDGTQTRDFIYIDDLLEAVVLASTRGGVGGQVFQIATNSETTMSELVEELHSLFDRRGLELPDVVNAPVRQGDIYRNYSDTSKAQEMLCWTPAVPLAEGLERTLDYFLEGS